MDSSLENWGLGFWHCHVLFNSLGGASGGPQKGKAFFDVDPHIDHCAHFQNASTLLSFNTVSSAVWAVDARS